MAVPRIKTFANGGTLLPSDLNSIQDDYGGRFDSVYVAGGFNADSVVRRGKVNIATAESRTNTAYGLLTTPDRVQNVVLPTDGLICVGYQATWQESVNGAALASIFVGANQLKAASSALSAPVTSRTEASIGSGTTAKDVVLGSHQMGLASLMLDANDAAAAYTGDVTTGQVIGGGLEIGYNFPTTVKDGSNVNQTLTTYSIVGGPCFIFAAAGTYDISVQFKSTSGSVTVKNRRLWVWTINF